MKKIYKLLITAATVIIIVLVAYQLTYSSGWRIFDDGMKGIRGYRFQLEMSIDEAKRHFSSYGKLIETIEKTEEEEYEMVRMERKVTWLTYKNMDEILVLKFVNDKLYGFSYVNWQIR